MTSTETFETTYRFLTLDETARGIHFCDTCKAPALFVRSDAKGFAVKACFKHGRLG
jgi:hypothetical protein